MKQQKDNHLSSFRASTKMSDVMIIIFYRTYPVYRIKLITTIKLNEI